ncbi:MAG: PDDEXK family nuclease [Anaerolineae bacterium]
MTESKTSSQPKPRNNPVVERSAIVFSHPSEAEFAKVLDFFGIEWRYEPTTFPIYWDEQGNLLEAFTPDFYLIEQDLYIELTTLRAKLMKVKHRKIKRMHELYPEIHIRLWSRADFMGFMQRFGLTGREPELVGKDALNKQ